jgi:hypothetical protein
MRRRPLLTTLACVAALTAAATPLPASARQTGSTPPATSSSPSSATSSVPSGALPGDSAGASSAVPPTTAAPPTTALPPTTAVPPTTAAPATTAVPASGGPTSPSSDDDKTAIVLIAAIGLVLLLTAFAWGAARWWAWEPPWLVRWRHATAEAGWRTSAAYAEFKDWLRLGR